MKVAVLVGAEQRKELGALRCVLVGAARREEWRAEEQAAARRGVERVRLWKALARPTLLGAERRAMARRLGQLELRGRASRGGA